MAELRLQGNSPEPLALPAWRTCRSWRCLQDLAVLWLLSVERTKAAADEKYVTMLTRWPRYGEDLTKTADF
jgi:hypothetical protein